MSDFHLAQLNIAKPIAALDDPIMKGFVENAERIDALADKSEGFIWRIEDKSAVAEIFKEDLLLINISVWKNVETLFNYVYHTDHVTFIKRQKQWFNKMKIPHMVSWYVSKDAMPSLKEAKQRLDYLTLYGETPYAFSFKNKFTIQDALNYKQHVI